MRFVVSLVILLALVSFGGEGTGCYHKGKKSDDRCKTAKADPIKDATVNLYCRLKAGKTIYSPSGSGVFISNRGVILTNAHVAQYFLLAQEKGRVTGWCSVRTGSPAEEMYVADVLYMSPSWLATNGAKISEKAAKGTGVEDFALLYVTEAKKGTLPATFPALSLDVATPLVEKAEVTVSGYPVLDLDFKGVRNKLSQLSAKSTITNIQSFGIGGSQDVITLSNSKLASSGASGGMMANSANNVVGIVNSISTGEDRLLRGISASYIDRTIRTQTGLPLSTMLAGDLAARAALTDILIPDQAVLDLANGLRKK